MNNGRNPNAAFEEGVAAPQNGVVGTRRYRRDGVLVRCECWSTSSLYFVSPQSSVTSNKHKNLLTVDSS